MTYYDNIADGYDELHKEEQLKKLEIIKQYIKPKRTDKLLDVGCGPYYGEWQCDVTGIDPSKEFIKTAKKKIKAVVGIAEELPFKDHEFDIVISITALQNFNNIEQGLKEIKRVGKDKFVLTFLKKSPKKDLILKNVKKIFKITKIIEEEKDIIVFV